MEIFYENDKLEIKINDRKINFFYDKKEIYIDDFFISYP
jgi:hypothetical protein